MALFTRSSRCPWNWSAISPQSRWTRTVSGHKINVLKIPVKKILGGFHIELSDIVHKSNTPGIEISGNCFSSIRKSCFRLRTSVVISIIRVQVPDIEVIYGGAINDETKLAQWHNFLRLRGGTLDFGKLTMHDVDLTMIDGSDDPWFDLDLVHYQDQLVNGYTRMTAEKGSRSTCRTWTAALSSKPAHGLASAGSKTARALCRRMFPASRETDLQLQ